jgi:hypothetical protein
MHDWEEIIIAHTIKSGVFFLILRCPESVSANALVCEEGKIARLRTVHFWR